MAGETYLVGEQKILPGVYVRIKNAGEPVIIAGAQGIGAALVQASWGPLGEVVTLSGLDDVTQVYGEGKGTNVLRELFRGGARQVKAVRIGTAGSKATVELDDDSATPVQVVKLETKYPTSRTFNVTIRESLASSTSKELLVYEGTKLLETITFPAGSGEPQALTDAVNASSGIFNAQKTGDGSGKVALVATKEVTGGADPTITASSYTDAQAIIEREDWNIIVTDSIDPVVHTTLHAFVFRLQYGGKRVIGIVGEPPSEDFEVRKTRAKSYNSPFLWYVGNGLGFAYGNVTGAEAAARVAGEVLRTPYTSSLTHHIIQGATDVVGALTPVELVEAVKSGMIVFSRNAQGQVQIESGVTTFVTPNEEYDAGWSKIRRVRTRYELINRIVMNTDPLVGRLDNDENGRATIVSIINQVITDMVKEGGLIGGSAAVDPNKQPQGDSAWFLIDVDDKDSLDRIYLEFGFRYAPAA